MQGFQFGRLVFLGNWHVLIAEKYYDWKIGKDLEGCCHVYFKILSQNSLKEKKTDSVLAAYSAANDINGHNFPIQKMPATFQLLNYMEKIKYVT
jgi:hypothetical protein